MSRTIKSYRVLEKIKELTVPSSEAKYVINRNPRNLERLRIAYKPSGYHLEKPGRSYWHKLELKSTGQYVSAEVKHFEAGTVITASTSEWPIKKQLFKTTDTSAYINLARVLAQRCLEAGLTEMNCDIKAVPNGKIDKFLKTLEQGGINLSEPPRFMPHRPWDNDRPEKPWEVNDE